MKNLIFTMTLLFLIVFCVQSEILAKQTQNVLNPSVVAPAAVPNSTTLKLGQLLSGIEDHCTGLAYISEIDSDIHSFVANRTVWTMTKSQFLFATQNPPLAYTEQLTFDEFFNPIINNDESGEWEALRDYLEIHLTDKTVFKVFTGNGFEYKLYAVGLFPVGGSSDTFYIVGISAFGVAT